MEPKILVIIPTYNEVSNINQVIEKVMVLSGQYSVLVVDDHSSDGTPDRVQAAAKKFPDRVFLLDRMGRFGLGSAYQAGFRYALDRDYDLICEMDADLSHNPDDLPSLTKPITDNIADLVIGSRYINGVRVINWPLRRLILSYGAGIYTRLITRIPTYDVTAGFKCIHRRVLQSLDLSRIHSNGYSFQIEINFRAWKQGFRIMEVPIIFTERREGQSKMSNAIVREAIFKVWELQLRWLFRKL